jgi:hypothetical protein
MGNEITCPGCGRTISNNPLVDSAATGEGQSTDSYVCECGEKITFWAATALLREEKRFSRRILKWLHSLSTSRA